MKYPFRDAHGFPATPGQGNSQSYSPDLSRITCDFKPHVMQLPADRFVTPCPLTSMEVEESESKPFDAELAQDGEETQPEPDETMITDSATGRVWIVKVSGHTSLLDLCPLIHSLGHLL